jgi:hypothetical protein
MAPAAVAGMTPGAMRASMARFCERYDPGNRLVEVVAPLVA